MMYKIIKDFTDKYDSSIKYKVGDELDFTEERASEILSVDTFIEKVGAAYKDKIGYAADFYVVEIGDGPVKLA